MSDVKWKLVPVEPTDEMLRASCAVNMPALFRTHLRHPDNGTSTRAATEAVIADARAQYAAMLNAAPASPPGAERFAAIMNGQDPAEVWRARAFQLADELDALAKPASEPAGGGVRVKPLEWREPEPDWWEAYSPRLRLGYEVSRRRDGTIRTRANGDEKFQTFAGTIEEAKAAAQADYEARIRSALSSPASSSPAEVEALQDGVEAHRLDSGLICEFDGNCYMLTWPDGHWLAAKADGSVIVGRSPHEQWRQPARKLSVAALSSAPAQEDGSKDLGAHPRGSNPGPSSVEAAAMTERLIDAAIDYEQANSFHRDNARKELNDARAAVEAALSRDCG